MSLLQTITEAWTGRYEPIGDVKKADCVIGFAFGFRGTHKSYRPGLSNEDMAYVLRDDFPKLPKILQIEIADAYADIDGPNAEDVSRMFRIYTNRKPGSYLDTREVAVQAQLIMQREGWKRAVILAHPYHMPRAVATCRKLGIEPIVPEHLRGAIEFDLQSAQGWTKNLDRWRRYEPLAIMLYKFRGWV